MPTEKQLKKKGKSEKNGMPSVIMLGHKRIPTREGGVEIVVRELAERMVRRGCKVKVYNRYDLFTPGGRVGERFYRGIQIRQIPTLHQSKVNAMLYSLLGSIALLFDPSDVVHYHAIGSCAMLFIPHLFGRRTVVTVHGLDWQRAKWGGFASWYLRLGERVAVRDADEIIVLSKTLQNYFLETYGRRTCLIPNGMEKMECPEPELIGAKYGVGRGDYVLYLARITPEKGLHYLIEAFMGVHTNKKLIVAGAIDWTNAYCLQNVETAKQDPRIEMVDLVQGREWAELFANCALYVLPSDVEGMPMSLLEAMSFHCRCLVSDIPENIEAGRGCVTTFEHSSSQDLKEKIQYLLDHPDEGRCENDDVQFKDWDEVTDETIALYQRVCAPDYRSTHREEMRAKKKKDENEKRHE